MATHVKIQVPANSTGEQLDTVQGTVTGITGSADRQVMVIGDPAFGGSGDALVGVINSQPAGTEYGLIVREAQKGQATMANSRPIVIASDQSTVPFNVPDLTASISFTANAQTQVLTMAGRASAACVITGTWTGTIVFEQSVDGSVWVGTDVYSEATETWVQSTTANGSFWFEPLGAVNAVRLRVSAWTSGTANGTILAAHQPMGTFEYQGNVAITAPPNAVQVGGTDGTNLRALSVDSTGKLQTVTVPTTSGGLTTSRLVSAASTNATSVKASAGQVYGWSIQNNNASPRYVKLYNKASAPTVGTDTPFMTLLIPGGSGGSGNNFMGDVGIPFSTGIAFAITTGGTDGDTGAVAVTEVFVNLFYK